MSIQQRARASHWRHLLSTLLGAVVAAVTLHSAKAGDVGTTTVEAKFTDDIQATDYKAGVTIKLNSISQTINSGTRQGDNSLVHFVIAAAADANDAITWEYDADLGDYADDKANPMDDVSATPATNYIGSHLYFDTAADAAWIGAA